MRRHPVALTREFPLHPRGEVAADARRVVRDPCPEQRLATGMRKEDVEGFLAGFASAARPVDVHFLWRPQLTDPADELVLEAAVNGRAQAIVTHNVRHFLPAARELGVQVITPGALLERMKE